MGRGDKDDCPYCDFWTISGYLNVHIRRKHPEKIPPWVENSYIKKKKK